MKKTILFAFALIAVLFTTTVSGQGTRPGGNNPGAGTTTGGTTGGGSNTVGDNKAGSNVGGNNQAGNNAGGSKAGGAITYPKVYVSTPSPTGGKATRRLLAGNLFKGKDQGVDLTLDIVDPSGNVIKDDASSITKGADGDWVIDASKVKSKAHRLRVKGNTTEFYPF